MRWLRLPVEIVSDLADHISEERPGPAISKGVFNNLRRNRGRAWRNRGVRTPRRGSISTRKFMDNPRYTIQLVWRQSL
jgi:hypothetical protein